MTLPLPLAPPGLNTSREFRWMLKKSKQPYCGVRGSILLADSAYGTTVTETEVPDHARSDSRVAYGL